MWIFADFGLLMPSEVPESVKNTPEVEKWTNSGEYDIQVRARLSEHLEYFMDNFMEEGTFNPTIQATPDKDYNFRFYTSREALAEGIKNVALSIDYSKFKPTSERFAWNKKYHEVLNDIWTSLCALASPGGVWGPKSEENPTGYDKASRWGSSWSRHDSRYDDTSRVGSSFFSDEELREFGIIPDYEPEADIEARRLIDELDSYGIDYDQWRDFSTESEWILLRNEVDRRAREAKKAHRASKKNRRKGKKTAYAKR